MSPGKEPPRLSSHVDYEEPYHFDVLGLSVTAPNDQVTCMLNLKSSLYEIRMVGMNWSALARRPSCAVLPNNKEGSLRRLNSLNKRQEIIEDQRKAGVVERTVAQ